jgi:hypothetical protein
MRRAARCGIMAIVAVVLAAGNAFAQAVPEGSQAARLRPAMRRWPGIGVDPFRNMFWPGWGFVISGGAAGWNNSVNADDIGALLFLNDSAKNPAGLLPSDYLDLIGLVPKGQGLTGVANGEGGVYLGGPFGRHLSIGLSAQARGYGTANVDKNVVRFFQEGNATDSVFDVGATSATALVTAEGGAHVLVNLGPVYSIDGPIVTIGVGGRYIRPLLYGRGFLGTDSRLFVTGDSIAAHVTAESQITSKVDAISGDTNVAIATDGSGFATDFLVRLTWPTAGFALEAMVANVGSVTIEGVRRDTVGVNVATSSLEDVANTLDSTSAETVGIDNVVKVTLPRIVRFAATAWANRILQLDAAATLPVSGDFATPLMVELGSTWRFVNVLPLRFGMLLDERQGIGFTGGFGIESRNFLFRLTGGSLGGFVHRATGVAGRLELGFFF